jgi:hypothetical protein
MGFFRRIAGTVCVPVGSDNERRLPWTHTAGFRPTVALAAIERSKPGSTEGAVPYPSNPNHIVEGAARGRVCRSYRCPQQLARSAAEELVTRLNTATTCQTD